MTKGVYQNTQDVLTQPKVIGPTFCQKYNSTFGTSLRPARPFAVFFRGPRTFHEREKVIA